jgi:2'-5' RNA ligase
MMQKSERSRWWIAIFLEELETGSVFTPGQLHLTLIPWFTTDAADEEVEEAFRQKFQAYPKFNLEPTEEVMFGPDKDVPVTLVQSSAELLELHQTSLELFNQLGGHWAVKNPYVDDEYRPHIRRRTGSAVVKAGQIIEVNSLILVEARRQEDNLRRVAQKVNLA